MCMALYVATREPSPQTEWREGEAVFCIQPLSESERGVTDRFSRPHVMYLGSHTGCSCGFAYGQTTASGPDDAREEENGRRSVAALRLFIEKQLASDDEVELFACWEGEQTATPEVHLNVTPEFFGGSAFALVEKGFYRVRRP